MLFMTHVGSDVSYPGDPTTIIDPSSDKSIEVPKLSPARVPLRSLPIFDHTSSSGLY